MIGDVGLRQSGSRNNGAHMQWPSAQRFQDGEARRISQAPEQLSLEIKSVE
ncbi:hypothetical protein N826_31865 [Skermanella aerolata KACC 11604]|nr:hypothetical protein N826_31865 [Skermanella aerolata KACC 11604]